MITKEERESIIQEAFERLLLHIPEVIGNLITNHTVQLELNKKFYDKYPEFKKHKDSVMSVVEQMEAKFPNLGAEKLYEKAVPDIKKRIKQVELLNTTTVTTKPDRQFEKIESANIETKHGEL